LNPLEATNPVTFAGLLEHTAGFDDFPLAEFYDFSAPPEKPLSWTLTNFRGPEHVRWNLDRGCRIRIPATDSPDT